MKDGEDGLVLDGIFSGAARDLEVKAVNPWLNTQIQNSQEVCYIANSGITSPEVVFWSALEV